MSLKEKEQGEDGMICGGTPLTTIKKDIIVPVFFAMFDQVWKHGGSSMVSNVWSSQETDNEVDCIFNE